MAQCRYYLQALGPNVGIIYKHGASRSGNVWEMSFSESGYAALWTGGLGRNHNWMIRVPPWELCRHCLEKQCLRTMVVYGRVGGGGGCRGLRNQILNAEPYLGLLTQGPNFNSMRSKGPRRLSEVIGAMPGTIETGVAPVAANGSVGLP